PEDQRKAWRAASYESKADENTQRIHELLRSAQEQVLVFTGNCSFINLAEQGTPLASVIHDLVQRGVTIKVLSRVDIASVTNLQKLLAINYGLGKDVIEVHHAEQPLRGFIVDDRIVRLKEELSPQRYRSGELDHDTVLVYEIYDPAWVKWAQNVFWALFRTSLAGQKRLEDLNTINKL
ncbi:MAG TPA: hypothetical protein VLJ21_00120, partial [Candidatus Binatia bacterium]|nr:hypothetical protein [Candidatus Binatia bacterium]